MLDSVGLPPANLDHDEVTAEREKHVEILAALSVIKMCNITALSVRTTSVISPQVYNGPMWADILLRAACSGWALV